MLWHAVAQLPSPPKAEQDEEGPSDACIRGSPVYPICDLLAHEQHVHLRMVCRRVTRRPLARRTARTTRKGQRGRPAPQGKCRASACLFLIPR
jgi:hypothetical protein